MTLLWAPRARELPRSWSPQIIQGFRAPSSCLSTRQWRDVLAVLRVQQRLDDTHMRTWADRLGIADLLVRALSEVEKR